MTEVDFYKFPQDYKVEHYNSDDPFALDLMHSYYETGKRLHANYSRKNILRLTALGRFKLGVFVAFHKNQPVASLAVDLYRDWAVMTRFVRYVDTPVLVPFSQGVLIPYLVDYLKYKVKGVCSTDNLDKKSIALISMRYFSKDKHGGIFTAAADTVKNTFLVPYIILNHDIPQRAYCYYTTSLPPFERYEPT